jgi:predicted NBD/HSP70 family sugar kinase
MRAHNRDLVLRLLWETPRISRAELARRTGLSRSTVSGIVQELEELGLAASLEARRGPSGRRPVDLALVDDAFAAVGVELGVRHVGALVSDLRGRVRAFFDASHDVRGDPAGALALVHRLVEAAIGEARLPRRRLLGLGVAVPSARSRLRPDRLDPRILPAWRDVDLAAALAAHRLPLHLDNDANLGALAERWWGVGVPDLAFVKVGAGVGAGLVVDGRLHRGASGTAGELGHTPVDRGGPVCACGNRGCVTVFVGVEALLARAGERTFAAVVARARRGEREATRVLAEAGAQLGVVVGGLVNLVDPGLVVVGGELASAGELVLAPLRGEVERRVMPDVLAATRIVGSPLGRRAVALGAATLVLRDALERGGLVEAARGLLVDA